MNTDFLWEMFLVGFLSGVSATVSGYAFYRGYQNYKRAQDALRAERMKELN